MMTFIQSLVHLATLGSSMMLNMKYIECDHFRVNIQYVCFLMLSCCVFFMNKSSKRNQRRMDMLINSGQGHLQRKWKVYWQTGKHFVKHTCKKKSLHRFLKNWRKKQFVSKRISKLFVILVELWVTLVIVSPWSMSEKCTQFSFRAANEKRIIANYLKYAMSVIFELFHIYKRDPFLADSDDKSNEAKWWHLQKNALYLSVP